MEQWTGFVDLEGKDIYEGDILETKSHDFPDGYKYQVSFDQTYGNYTCDLILEQLMKSYIELYEVAQEDCNVIGNVNQK